MAVKQKNTKKKMALLGLKKDKDGDYRYIDPDDTTSEFVPVSGITLIEGRRLDPLGTYSITNLEESYVIW